MTDTASRALRPHEVRHYAETLSRFADDSVVRQIAIHVDRQDFTADDAQVVYEATNRRRAEVHADALAHAFMAVCTARTDSRGVTHHHDSPACPSALSRLF